uniref:cytochrome-c peroxidase n=1 Tax=Pedobacter schmidteae TaxID=2201271 RepID=UPI0013CEEB19|nr:cytochrome c peroxidase [Pedobacter schmidteae]
MSAQFLKTRQAFKKLEWFCEYYAPGVSREVNGAPLPEIEAEETKSFEPSGLQVIEEYLYPYQPAESENLKRELASLAASLNRFKLILRDTELTEARIFDACKLEIFRITISGITGFDTPLSNAGITEAAVSLKAVGQILQLFGTNHPLQNQFEQASAYIKGHPDFNTFDRMIFIRNYANPITKEIVKWQEDLNIKPLEIELALRKTTTTLFDKDMFNVKHFVNSAEAMPSPEKLSLGKQLFGDAIISGSSHTCKTCHKPELAFTDGLIKSKSLTAGQSVKRNAPTLYYAGLQNAQFYDMRFQTLENQAMDVIANKDEMHGSVEDAAKRLQQSSYYNALFKKAFPTMETEIKPRFVMIAIASYIRSLNPFNSRFDKYMRGDNHQMNKDEVKGFNLFMGKAKCATCHFMPIFNGTAGPVFSNTEAEVLGTLADPEAKKPTIDSDEGRYTWTKMDVLKFAFKTPTLRNVDLTAPYMHNGAYKTLEQVMDFYNQGGAAGKGLALDNQTLPSDPLNLSKKEIQDIIAFLKTLNDQ